MQTPTEIADRWRYLRQLLREQLGRFEDGSLSISTAGDDTSPAAITRLKREIEDFDNLISQSDKRNGQKLP